MMAPSVAPRPEGQSSPDGSSARAEGVSARGIAVEEVELRRLAAVVDSSADAILSKDRDCRITSWNRGAESLYGYTASEIIGQLVSVLVPDDHAGEERAILDRVLRGEDVGRYETQRLAKDGLVIDVSITVSPIYGDTGEVIGASSIHRDITEQRRAREELGLRAELLDLAHDAVIVPDPAESRVTFWNREAQDMYGYRRAEAVGQVTHELLATIFPESSEAVEDALAREGRWFGELRHTRKDGRVILVSSRQPPAASRQPPGAAARGGRAADRDHRAELGHHRAQTGRGRARTHRRPARAHRRDQQDRRLGVRRRHRRADDDGRGVPDLRNRADFR
jgi:PAS domain S-box-containing protein